MCGIVGGVADRNIVPVLMEGLKRLEYRGYDSAGIAVLNAEGHLQRLRTVGKVRALEQALAELPIQGRCGIAHTRWATHGVPSERNAHPHISRGGLAIVHNGIIENYEELRDELKLAGYQFSSETDTEVVAHRVHFHLEKLGDLFKAVRATVAELEGAYALAVISEQDPGRLIAARVGCPVVLGLGLGESFVASDVAALLPVTRRFMFLDEGDVAEIRRSGVRVIDRDGNSADRPLRESELSADAAEKGQYRHFMLKEIHEQPRAVANTLQERIANGRLLEAAFGPAATAVFDRVEAVHIVACGTSYHAGVVARYFIEQVCRISCQAEIASEYRYRNPVVPKNSLFVVISQSGETADTLAALRMARQNGYLSTLAICNAPESSLVRESELVMLTRAGPEIGVASTKAFTTQLTALAMLTAALARHNGADPERERSQWSTAWRCISPTSGTHCFSGEAPCTLSRWKERSSSRRSPTSMPRRTRPASSSMGRWHWSMPTCRWLPWRPTMSCSTSSSPTSWKCARAAACCTCSPIRTPASNRATACTSSICPST